MAKLIFNSFCGLWLIFIAYLVFDEYLDSKPKFKVGQCVQQLYIEGNEFAAPVYEVFKVVAVGKKYYKLKYEYLGLITTTRDIRYFNNQENTIIECPKKLK